MRMLEPAAILICAILMNGCGSGHTQVNGPVSGNWEITLQTETSSETQSGFLLQTGNTITGGFSFSGQTISGQISCAGVGSALGQTTGSAVTIAVSPTGQTVNLTGSTTDNFTSMSGDYSILAAGCGQTEVGTWTANAVKPLAGNVQATFSLAGSADSHFSGTITQGPNTGASAATLSGTMTSTDSPCFTSVSIAGAISGTSVVLNLLTGDGQALGKYAGTMTTDATSITGSYRFTNATNPELLGACEGDGGSATVTIQPSPAKT